MAEPIHNPLPVPPRKKHTGMDFALKENVAAQQKEVSFHDRQSQAPLKYRRDDFDFPGKETDEFDFDVPENAEFDI